MATERQIEAILAHPFDREWSIQGFGMLRTYLDDEHIERLHIWDTDTAVDEVSTLHDHPWDFTSHIVCGRIRNHRYKILENDLLSGTPHRAARIRCGEGGGVVEALGLVRIGLGSVEFYSADQTYSMEAPELHESFPEPGAVTVITRSFKPDRDVATVCWRTGEWVSAEPRAATRAEIEHFVALARTA